MNLTPIAMRVSAMPDLRISRATVKQAESIATLIGDQLAALPNDCPQRETLSEAWVSAVTAAETVAKAQRLLDHAEGKIANVDNIIDTIRLEA